MERLPIPRDMEVVTPAQQAIREAVDALVEASDLAAFLVGHEIVRLHDNE